MKNQLDTLIESFHMEINEEIISDLVSNKGYSLEDATKVVAEFGEFDLAASAVEYPVTE
jgi:hypothetical protein